MFTKTQAKKKAEQIYDRFGSRITAASNLSGIEAGFIAGFIGVEAGIDRKGWIREEATRFEPGVYQDLISLRDKGFCFVAGKKLKNYSGVTQAQIKDASDAAIRALSTSYSLSQIMGWHVINNLKTTIADLKDPEQHLLFTVKLLKIVGGNYLTRKDYDSVMRIWNTGNANGKTYHDDYVDNSRLVMDAYKQLCKEKGNPLPAEVKKIKEKSLSINSAVAGAGEINERSVYIPSQYENENLDSKPEPAAEQPTEQPTQQIENQINLNADNSENKPEPDVKTEDKTLQAPLGQRLKDKVHSWFAWLGLAPPTAAGGFVAVKSYWQDGQLNLAEILGIMLQIFYFVFPYIAYIVMLYIIYQIILMIFKQASFLMAMWLTGDPKKNNITIVSGDQPSTAPTLWQKIIGALKPAKPATIRG